VGRRPSFLSRRDVVTGAAAIGASGLVPLARAFAQPMPMRRFEVSEPSMRPGNVGSYRKAVAAMLQLPPTDPRNWYRQALVHVLDCPHGNWWFLPWHRAYLGNFEKTCRKLSGDPAFTLPYWDWTSSPSVPAAVFEGVLDPNDVSFIDSFAKFRQGMDGALTALWGSFGPEQRSALALRGLDTTARFWAAAQGMFFERPNARGIFKGAPALDDATKLTVSAATVGSALGSSTFAGRPGGSAGFGSGMTAQHSQRGRKGVLESQPHDNVHVSLGGANGGFMMDMLSPVDPLFWLHHANVDRLWDVWTRRRQKAGKPAVPEGADLTAWSKETFRFFSDEDGKAIAKVEAGAYASTSSLSYDYSPGFGDAVPQAASSASAQTAFGGAVTSERIGSPTPAGGLVRVPAAALAQGVPAAASVTLDLSHGDEGRRFRVVASAEGGAPRDIGAISIFGHHVIGMQTFSVPLPAGLVNKAGEVAIDVRVLPLVPAPGGKVAARLGPIQPKVSSVAVVLE